MPAAVDRAGDVAGQDRLSTRRGGRGDKRPRPSRSPRSRRHDNPGPMPATPDADAAPRPRSSASRRRHCPVAARRARDDPDRQAPATPTPTATSRRHPDPGGRVSSMTMPSPALGSQPPEEAPVTRRSTELLMTAFALGIVALAFASTAFSLKGQHPSTIIEYIVAYTAIIVGAHLAVRKFAPYADPLLLPIATVLNGLGLVMIYRLNQVGRSGNPGPTNTSGRHPISTLSSSATVTQIIYTVLGVVVFVLFLWRIKDIKVLQPYTYVLGLAGLVLIALPALLPSSISGVAGHRRQDPDQHRRVLRAAGGVRQAAARGVVRQLPDGARPAALPAHRQVALLQDAAAQGPRADPGGLGAQHAAADLRERHRHQRGVHGPVRGDALHRDRAALVGGARVRHVHRRRVRSRRRSCRTWASGSASGCTRSATRT